MYQISISLTLDEMQLLSGVQRNDQHVDCGHQIDVDNDELSSGLLVQSVQRPSITCCLQQILLGTTLLQ